MFHVCKKFIEINKSVPIEEHFMSRVISYYFGNYNDKDTKGITSRINVNDYRDL